MSKQQEKLLRLASAIGSAILVFGIAYGTMKTQMCDTVAKVERHDKRLNVIEGHIIEQRTDIKWIRHALEKDK